MTKATYDPGSKEASVSADLDGDGIEDHVSVSHVDGGGISLFVRLNGQVINIYGKVENGRFTGNVNLRGLPETGDTGIDLTVKDDCVERGDALHVSRHDRIVLNDTRLLGEEHLVKVLDSYRTVGQAILDNPEVKSAIEAARTAHANYHPDQAAAVEKLATKGTKIERCSSF